MCGKPVSGAGPDLVDARISVVECIAHGIFGNDAELAPAAQSGADIDVLGGSLGVRVAQQPVDFHRPQSSCTAVHPTAGRTYAVSVIELSVHVNVAGCGLS